MSLPSPWQMVRGLRTPPLEPWRGWDEPEAAARTGELRVMFLGVSSLLFTDGETALLTDGYFSRPGLVRLRAGRVRPDRARIRQALDRFGIRRLAAVVVVHSHVDHALDSATVAELTGAQLVGSASTREIARGHGFSDDRFIEPEVACPLRFGDFEVTVLPAVHSPGDLAPGEIEGPFEPHARATDYRTGDCYTLHLRHRGRSLMVQASANRCPGATDGWQAETVHLGIGTLGKQSPEFREDYWRQYVLEVGARRVVPIHWDNFTRPLTKPLRPFPGFFDDFTTTMQFLSERSRRDGIEVALPVLGRLVDPWRGSDAPAG